MKHNGTNNLTVSVTPNELFSNDNYYNIIDKWSNLSFYDNNLNRISINVSPAFLPDIYQFSVSAEKLLKSNTSGNSYLMIVFDIDKFNELYGDTVGDDLISNISSTLQFNIQEPSLYCRMNDESFVLFLENYKAIDIASLVIQLTEELSNFKPEIKTKLSFGVCRADHLDHNIPSLCRRAFYAKATIQGQNQQLLANYNELVFDKKTVPDYIGCLTK